MTGIITAMCIYAFSMSITPGPVNMLIISSAANYGLKRGLSIALSASIAFAIILVLTGLVLNNIFHAFPLLLSLLTLLGGLFIIWLGYKIAFAAPSFSANSDKAPHPMQGALLQILNPKAWIAAAAGISIFYQANQNQILILFVLIYFVLCYLCLAFWAYLGSKAALLLNTTARIRLFNFIMGGLLIMTALYMLYSHFFTSTTVIL